MIRCTSIISALLFTHLQFSFVQAWGSKKIERKFRPKVGFQSKFPSTATTTVQTGGSVASALGKCDEKVGKKGYCTIQLLGNPSDKTIYVTRSRTKLLGNAGVLITTRGSRNFIELSKTGLRKIVLEGLVLSGHSASAVFGIVIIGTNIRQVVIRNNKIHGFKGRTDAHGIAVYGDGVRPITNILIKENKVYNMKTGSSESIVVNGNVERWAISDNYVHDVNNIAIDAIGGEGTLLPTNFDRVLPNPDDAARYGFIENNVVEQMSTKGNPAYGRAESWAASVYVDGAHHILIQGNDVRGSPWGIEIGAENCVISRDVVVRNNSVSGSFFGDFLVGGYAKRGYLQYSSIKCDPTSTQDDNEGHGYVQRITVEKNSFQSTGSREDNIVVQYRTSFAVIKEPGVSSENKNGDGSAEKDENAIRTS